MSVQVLQGDCIAVMRALKDNSVDAICTDPPYGLEFMGKTWDGADGFRRSLNPADADRENVFGRTSKTSPEYITGKPSGARIRRQSEHDRTTRGNTHNTTTSLISRNAPESYVAGSVYEQWCQAWAEECLRVLKPGGHLLAFGGTRTYHRLACGIEDAGFEIRDSLHWVYASGFPKSKACLKPSHEPVVLARKSAKKMEPFPGLDACRVAHVSEADRSESVKKNQHADFGSAPRQNHIFGDMSQEPAGNYDGNAGRWPPNIMFDEEMAAELDKQSGVKASHIGKPRRSSAPGDGYGMVHTGSEYEDTGGASRFFPCFRFQAKASSKERPRVDGIAHPTVKPLGLMRWLVRLVTPPGGIVLDPFAGSGTTGEACLEEGFNCILIEREPDYVKLIKTRLNRREPTLWD